MLKKLSEKSKISQNSDFCTCPIQNVVKHNVSGKKGKLPCCKCLFDQIKANLAEIQAGKPPKCPKNAFLAKSYMSQWVKEILIYWKMWQNKTHFKNILSVFQLVH